MQIKKRTGESEPFQLAKLQRVLDEAARGLPGVDVDAVAVDVEVGLYDGMASKGLADLLLDVALSHVGDDPDYSLLAARILLFDLYKRILGKSSFVDLGSPRLWSAICSLRGW
jgi:ribonucleoside-diphosphate reductase alpha chain